MGWTRIEERPPIGMFLSLFGPVLVLIAVVVIVLVIVAATRGDAGDRRGRLLPLVYYYLATVVGLALVLAGVIGGLHGLVTAAFPKTADEFIFAEPPFSPEGDPVKESPSEKAEREAEALERSRQSGYAGAIQGGITALVGAPVFFWHLRQARRKEPELGSGTAAPGAGPALD
jgi:hypothetical protein